MSLKIPPSVLSSHTSSGSAAAAVDFLFSFGGCPTRAVELGEFGGLMLMLVPFPFISFKPSCEKGFGDGFCSVAGADNCAFELRAPLFSKSSAASAGGFARGSEAVLDWPLF